MTKIRSTLISNSVMAALIAFGIYSNGGAGKVWAESGIDKRIEEYKAGLEKSTPHGEEGKEATTSLGAKKVKPSAHTPAKKKKHKATAYKAPVAHGQSGHGEHGAGSVTEKVLKPPVAPGDGEHGAKTVADEVVKHPVVPGESGHGEHGAGLVAEKVLKPPVAAGDGEHGAKTVAEEVVKHPVVPGENGHGEHVASPDADEAHKRPLEENKQITSDHTKVSARQEGDASARIEPIAGIKPATAMHPDLVVPEKVESSHKACREIMRIGKKYQVEGLFIKEFVEGQCQLSRLDVAVAVQMLTEKMAEKAAKDGFGAIDKEDLAILSDLKEELRGEMLLAQARAFQTRYTELGTNLHALTKNITLSGGMTGVLQGSAGNTPRDTVDAVGRADLIFNFKVGESTIAVIDLEATGGSGIDAHVGNFSILNNVPMQPTDTVRFRTAWVEHSAFSDRLIFTVGKISLTDYFDNNNVANNETSQFLSGAFVNSAVLGTPANGPGLRINGKLNDHLTVGLGYGSGDASAADIADHGFGIVELDYKQKIGELEGNYRFYCSLDGALPVTGGIKIAEKDALGAGVSIDQQVTEQFSLFGRYGWHDDAAYKTNSAWSAGFQYAGLIPQRKDDLIGFSFGQVLATNANAQEKLLESYYKVKLSDQLAVSPHFQYLINPMGDKNTSNVAVMSIRMQLIF